MWDSLISSQLSQQSDSRAKSISPIEKSLSEKIRTGLKNPSKFISGARRTVGKRENRLLGVDLIDEDWDNLLILDACRYDIFEQLNTIPGTLESRRSSGSATLEFVRNNFANRSCHEIVYVTANPYVSLVADGVFHEHVPLWRTDWDDDLSTVRPESVARAVRDAASKHPDKRLVGHFAQPHHPFIGSYGRERIDEAGNVKARKEALGEAPPDDCTDVWSLVESGKIGHNTVVRAYEENLELALSVVRDLVDDLEGKTVITSDHGNLFDEPAYPVVKWGSHRYAHPMHATAEPLVKIPWLICPYENRRSITADPPVDADRSVINVSTIEDRLSDLGYTEF